MEDRSRQAKKPSIGRWGKKAFFMLTILCCVTVMSGTALAYFGTQKSWGLGQIRGAYYEVEIQGVSGNDYLCGMAYEDSHSFQLTAAGTASAGYCLVTIEGEEYLTGQISPESPMELTVKAAAGTRIRFSPCLGSVSTGDGSMKIYQSGETIEHSHTTYAEYQVAEGAELDRIAGHYGVQAEDILTFNNITALTVGDTIKIPGADPGTAPYEVPAVSSGDANVPVSSGDAQKPVSGGDAEDMSGGGEPQSPVSSGDAMDSVSSGDAGKPVSSGDAV